MTTLRLEEFFDGPASAYGIFQDRFGKPRRLFNAEVEPTFEDGLLTLLERFTFDDGAEEQRTWKIRPESDGYYKATADGVIGQAAGQVEGPALRWRYAFALNIGSRIINVQFDDFICQQSESVLINLTVMKKWGFHTGDLNIIFLKQQSAIET